MHLNLVDINWGDNHNFTTHTWEVVGACTLLTDSTSTVAAVDYYLHRRGGIVCMTNTITPPHTVRVKPYDRLVLDKLRQTPAGQTFVVERCQFLRLVLTQQMMDHYQGNYWSSARIFQTWRIHSPRQAWALDQFEFGSPQRRKFIFEIIESNAVAPPVEQNHILWHWATVFEWAKKNNFTGDPFEAWATFTALYPFPDAVGNVL